MNPQNIIALLNSATTNRQDTQWAAYAKNSEFLYGLLSNESDLKVKDLLSPTLKQLFGDLPAPIMQRYKTTPNAAAITIQNGLSIYNRLVGAVSQNEITAAKGDKEKLPINSLIGEWGGVPNNNLLELLLQDVITASVTDHCPLMAIDFEIIDYKKMVYYYKIFSSASVYSTVERGGGFDVVITKEVPEKIDNIFSFSKNDIWRLSDKSHNFSIQAIEAELVDALSSVFGVSIIEIEGNSIVGSIKGRTTDMPNTINIVKHIEGNRSVHYVLIVAEHFYGRCPFMRLAWNSKQKGAKREYQSVVTAASYEAILGLYRAAVVLAENMGLYARPIAKVVNFADKCSTTSVFDCEDGKCGKTSCNKCNDTHQHDDKEGGSIIIDLATTNAIEVAVPSYATEAEFSQILAHFEKVITFMEYPEAGLNAALDNFNAWANQVHHLLSGTPRKINADTQKAVSSGQITATEVMAEEAGAVRKLRAYVLHVVSLYTNIVQMIATQLKLGEATVTVVFPADYNTKSIEQLANEIHLAKGTIGEKEAFMAYYSAVVKDYKKVTAVKKIADAVPLVAVTESTFSVYYSTVINSLDDELIRDANSVLFLRANFDAILSYLRQNRIEIFADGVAIKDIATAVHEAVAIIMGGDFSIENNNLNQ